MWQSVKDVWITSAVQTEELDWTFCSVWKWRTAETTRMKHVLGRFVLTDSFISLSHSAGMGATPTKSAFRPLHFRTSWLQHDGTKDKAPEPRKSITTTISPGELVHSPPITTTKPFPSTSCLCCHICAEYKVSSRAWDGRDVSINSLSSTSGPVSGLFSHQRWILETR